MDVEVKLSENDLSTLGAYILRRESAFRLERVRRTALRAVVVLVCATVALFVFQGQGAPEAAVQIIVTYVLLMGIYLAGIYFGGGASATKRVNKIIGSKDMEAAEARHYFLSDEGISYQGSGGSGQATWKDIAEISDTDEYLYVFARGQHPYVLPRRAFRNDQEASQFLRLARDYHSQHLGTAFAAQ